LFFKGFEKGNVSIVAATMNIWAVVVLRDKISALQGLGMALAVVGIITTAP